MSPLLIFFLSTFLLSVQSGPIEPTSSEATQKPAETDVKPLETDTKPAETDAKPIETDTKPVETVVNIETTKPSETDEKPEETYDFSQFEEVHDQRQNGTENWRVNLDKIVLVWAPPEQLLTAALLLPSDSLFGETEDPEDFFKPETTTKGADAGPVDSSNEVSKLESTSTGTGRRILKLPGFLKPFVRRRHAQK